jgi:toxin ParE1/3/4
LGEAWPVRIRFTRRGAGQLDAILDYIEERSPKGAQKVMDRIDAALQLVAEHPALDKSRIKAISGGSSRIRTLK